MKIPVLEIFGPTIQGEGMVIGRKTMFVRTAGCDYGCSWCDSKFTWDGSEKDLIQMMEPEEIFDALKAKGGNKFNQVTISCGNTALLRQLGELVDILHDTQIQVALETQGSKWQDWFTQIDDLTISPKPPSSGMKTDFEKLDFIIDALNKKQQGMYSLKIVIFDHADFNYAKDVHQRYPDAALFLQVGNEHIEQTNDEQLITHLLKKYEQLVDLVMEDEVFKDVRVLPQLHTYLWGNKRGV